MVSMPQNIFSQRSTSDQDKPEFPSNSHFSKAFKPIFTYSSDVLCKQSEIGFLREIKYLWQQMEMNTHMQEFVGQFFREIDFFSNCFAFTEFLSKSARVSFTKEGRKTRNSMPRKLFSVKSI